jgi:cytochrome c peroxidase
MDRSAGGVFRHLLFALGLPVLLAACGGSEPPSPAPPPLPLSLDEQLRAALAQQGFTGTVEQKLEARLGRPLDFKRADLGRLLFFDPVSSLHNDNSCAACHSPSHGYGDTQSIAIGIQNNLIAGPDRQGPRNRRRSPLILNAFDNSLGFGFPQPEGTASFRPGDPAVPQLLVAQAFLPPTELIEEAGFTGIRDGLDPRYFQFDDGKGESCPALDAGGFRNGPIRARVEQRLNAIPAYVEKFGDAFSEVRNGAAIDISMFARAIAEYEFILKGANAPIDRYARGDAGAMTDAQKRGALLFFGKANCVACHAVSGKSNEMFSDFRMHNIGVPQIAPVFGLGTGNVIFDGPEENEGFGLEQVTGLVADRYRFRSSPLRNVALQPAFFHNGAFTRLEDAVRHHLDVMASLRSYDARRAGVAPDLAKRMAPIARVAASIDPLLRRPLQLGEREFDELVQFVRSGLLDESTLPAVACSHIPAALPSGLPLPKFQSCPAARP